MLDAFNAVNWNEYYYFLTKGTVPIAIQLLLLNTVFLVMWMVRRSRGWLFVRGETIRALQWVFLAANFLILMNGDFAFL